MRRTAAGLYVVAAAVVMDTPDKASAAAKEVLLPRQSRFHWRDELDRQRYRMLDCMLAAELAVYGYIRRSVPARGQERARALCLRRLLWDLQDAKVDEVVLESRHAADRRDRQTIVRAQKAGVAATGLKYRHAFPDSEPPLWLADAAAGAIAAHAAEENAAYLDRLGPCSQVIEVEP